MTRRRLLFYTHALVGGGAERVWALLATGLKRRGHDVSFAVDFEDEANARFLDPSIERVTLGRGHWGATRALARRLAATAPDAAFAAVGASNLKLTLAKALSGWRGAAVLSAHGRFDAEHGLLGRTTYLLTPLLSRATARTIAVSDDLRRYLVGRFLAPPGRTVAIPNGVDLPPRESVPTAEALRARPDVVVAMGRLVPEKDMVLLVEALALMRRPARLVLLGEGPDRPRVEAAAARLGLGDRVELRGYVPEPWPALASAKALALGSRTEAFGNVLVEALGHGLPVISTDCGGPAEILDGGRFGRLVPKGDAAAMAAALDAALEDPGDPATHRARAEDFALDRALDRIEGLLDEVAAVR